MQVIMRCMQAQYGCGMPLMLVFKPFLSRATTALSTGPPERATQLPSATSPASRHVALVCNIAQ